MEHQEKSVHQQASKEIGWLGAVVIVIDRISLEDFLGLRRAVQPIKGWKDVIRLALGFDPFQQQAVQAVGRESRENRT